MVSTFTRSHVRQLRNGPGDPASDFADQRATRDSEGNGYGDFAAVDLDGANHVELDDGAVQLRILHGTQNFDDLVPGNCHPASLPAAFN